MPISKPRLIIEVFEHLNFGGRRGYVNKPVPFTAEIGFQDNISSVKVYKGPSFGSSPNHKAILHEHLHFQGKNLVLGPGFYPNLHDMIYNFKDNISSISFASISQASGPEWGTVPLILECYEHAEFRGRNITVLRDVPHTAALGLHDSISSVRIFKGPDFPPEGAEVTFFEHVDFEGAKLAIQMGPADYKKEITNFSHLPQYFNDVVSSIKIEGWSTSAEFTEMVFQDEFIGNQMHPEWRWEDPNGGGQWSEQQGYLEMRAEPGQDLWHGSSGNLDAPRLLLKTEGDFSAECRIRLSPDMKEHGGLIVWKSPQSFVRLEKTSGPHAFRGDVRFERHVDSVFSLVGRGTGVDKRMSQLGPMSVRFTELYLRLERKGNQFSGYASPDGVRWLSCGQTNVGMGDPVEVGLHTLCPGNIPPTLTRFEYFRLFKRKGDTLHTTPHLIDHLRLNDRDFARREREARSRALRSLT